MFQGMGRDTDALNSHWGFEPAQVQYLILSHAHIDHCGLIPKFVKDGFKGKIFCTPATKELTAVLLEDSAKIQEDDVRYINKKRAAKGEPLLEPLYDANDARNAFELFNSVEYGQWHIIDEHVEVLYTDAGHIIGSAAVHLKIKEEGRTVRLSFSGDVGRYHDAILRSPDNFPQADYILLESTYGNKLHDIHSTNPEMLLSWIEKTCLQKKGKLIMPAFSVGRTQELLYALNQLEEQGRLPALDYYVDSPLSKKATELMTRYPQYFNDAIRHVLETDNDVFSFKGLKFINDAQESKQLNFRNDPFVVISASGMAEAGRIKHHISNTIENSRNTILLTGYCEPYSLGGRLIAGNREVSIFGVMHEVHAEIGSIRSMSAHGDYEDLIRFLGCQNPAQVKRLFLVHGEYDVQQDFRERLLQKGFAQVEIPEMHSTTLLQVS